MKILKRSLPFLLAGIIIAGGFFGIYGMEMLIPNEKDTIVRSEKRAANQLLYVEEGESLVIYPWDHYDPDKTISLAEFGAEADSWEFTEFAYKLDTFLYESKSSADRAGEQMTSGQTMTNMEGFHFFESVQDLFESMEILQTQEFVFLHDKACQAVWDGRKYRLSLGMPASVGEGVMPVCYLHLLPVNREPVSKDQMRRASEELEKMQREAYSLYQEFMEMLGTEEIVDGSNAIGQDSEFYDNPDSEWEMYLEKIADGNALVQYLVYMSNLSGIDPYYLAEVLFLQDYYSFSYDNEVLMVFSASENTGGSGWMIVLYYDPIQKQFTGYSIKV